MLLARRRNGLTSMLWMRPGCCTVQNICLNILDCCTLWPLFTFSNRLIPRIKEVIKYFPVDDTNSSSSENKLQMYNCAFLFVRPLADSEKLPVRAHRAAEAPKSPVEDGDAASQEPKKKSSKEKREKKDKDRDRKVRKKLPSFHNKIILLSSWILASFCWAGETA